MRFARQGKADACSYYGDDEVNMLLPKNPRVKDRDYLDSYRDTACEACGTNDGTVVGAHNRRGQKGGMGMKPSDCFVAGLCYSCHQTEHSGRDGSVEIWMAVLDKLLSERFELWREENSGNGRSSAESKDRKG